MGRGWIWDVLPMAQRMGWLGCRWRWEGINSTLMVSKGVSMVSVGNGWAGSVCGRKGVEIDKTGLGCGTAAWYCAFGLAG